MAKLIRASVAMDVEMMERFDELVKEGGYESRSEAIQDLIRQRLGEESWVRAGDDALATVTMVYDHHERGVSQRVRDMGHDHFEEMQSSLHIHLDVDTCLEVVVLRGETSKIRRIASQLIGMKGVLHGDVVFSPIPAMESDSEVEEDEERYE